MSFFKKLLGKGNKKDEEKNKPQVKQSAPVSQSDKARQEENRKKMEAMYAQQAPPSPSPPTPTTTTSAAAASAAVADQKFPPQKQQNEHHVEQPNNAVSPVSGKTVAATPVAALPTLPPPPPLTTRTTIVEQAAVDSATLSESTAANVPTTPSTPDSGKKKEVFGKKNMQVFKEKLKQARTRFLFKPKTLRDSVTQMQQRMKIIMDVCKEVNMADIFASKLFYINRDGVFKNAGEKVGIQVWRIVRMIPVLVPESEHGKFYTGDCYLVLKTNEAKYEEERLRKLHMWMGRHANNRKRAICAYLAWELSSKLHDEERKAHHFGEEDCEESSVFRDYFRKIEPLEGEASSETLRPVEKLCYEERMIRIVANAYDGRLMAVRDLIPKRNDFATVAKDQDVLLLVDDNHIFVWLGKDSAQPFQIKALDIASMIFSEERKGRDCKVHIVDQGNEPEQFWETLQTFEEEEEDQQLSIPDEKRKEEDVELLFEITFNAKEKNVDVVKMEQRPLVRQMLDTRHVYLLATKYEIYKWYGLKSNQESRRYAKALAGKLIKHGRAFYNYSAFEGCESVLFQDRFTAGFYMVETPVTYEERRIRLANIRLGKMRDDIKGKFASKDEEETKKPLSYMDPKDDGSGTIHMFRVIDSKTAEPIKEEEIGHFYSNESYLILYLYNRGEAEEDDEEDEDEEAQNGPERSVQKEEGKKEENIENTKEILRANKAKKKKIKYLTRRIMYAWEGPMSNENVYSRALKKNFKGLHNAKKNPALLINTTLGKEDEHFLKVFGHKMVIHTGDREEKSDKTLYRMFFNSIVNSRAVQVDCKKSSLNSNNVYLLVSGKMLYVWVGQFIIPAQKKIANKFAHSLNEGAGRTVVELSEGKETKQFWREFEDQQKEGEEDYVKQKHDYTRGTVYEIFITNTNYRVMDAGEAGKSFTCHDLADCHNILVFDFKDIIYLWYPRDMLEAERKIGLKVASHISKNDEEEEGEKQILEIYKGKEPMGFKHGFVQWEEREPFEDIFELKREHAAKRQAQKMSKCVPFLKVMREKYPQLLTDDEHVNIHNIAYMVDLARQLGDADKLLKKIGKHQLYKFTPQFATAIVKFTQDNFPPLKRQ